MKPQNNEHAGTPAPPAPPTVPRVAASETSRFPAADSSTTPPVSVRSFTDELWLGPTTGAPNALFGDSPGSGIGGAQRPLRRPPGRLWVALAVTFCVALVSAGLLVFGVDRGANSASQLAAFVEAAAHKTAAEKTAHFSLSGSVSAGGINVPVSGNGELDSVSRRASFEMNVKVEGVPISLDEIVTPSDVFERIPGVLGTGQEWIDTPIPETSTGVELGDGAGDPANQLSLLSESGASVSKLGMLEIGGVETTEYSVAPSKKHIAEGIKEALSAPDLSPTVKEELEGFQKRPPSLKLDAWIDASGHLRRIEENLSLPLIGSSSNNSGNLVFSFDRFGAPDQIALPPLSDVTSISGFEDSAADRVAQSNLTNAMTEAKALYQVDQSYASGDNPYSVKDFGSQAPEFSWTSGACKPGATNCISFEVLDVASAHDHQGVALAIYSNNGMCWYAVDLETNPNSLPGDPAAIWTTWNGGANVDLSAGVFYARTDSGEQSVCSASDVLHPGFVVGWGQSYASAGTIG